MKCSFDGQCQRECVVYKVKIQINGKIKIYIMALLKAFSKKFYNLKTNFVYAKYMHCFLLSKHPVHSTQM